jgi:hypothetical protein
MVDMDYPDDQFTTGQYSYEAINNNGTHEYKDNNNPDGSIEFDMDNTDPYGFNGFDDTSNFPNDEGQKPGHQVDYTGHENGNSRETDFIYSKMDPLIYYLQLTI